MEKNLTPDSQTYSFKTSSNNHASISLETYHFCGKNTDNQIISCTVIKPIGRILI